ncbi:MAG: aminoglycoside 3'-phosphotransferase/choline kinase family protein [Pyrinomonadaceae bacterium]
MRDSARLSLMSLKLPASTDAAGYERHFKDDRAWRRVAAAICARHNLAQGSLRRSPLGENVIFFVDERYVIKIYGPLRRQYERERASLEFAHGKLSIETPEVVHAGELDGWPYLVMTRLAGVPLRERWPEIETRDRFEIVTSLGCALRELHAHRAPLSPDALNRDWHEFVMRQARESVGRQKSCGANAEWLESLPPYLDARLGMLPAQFERVLLHGDVHPGNVLVSETRGGRARVTGLFDFGDSFCGFHEYDFVAPGVLMVQGRRELQRALLLAYGYAEAQLDYDLRARLMLLTILYECSDLRKYALRLAPDAVRLTLDELEAAIWPFATP